METSNIWVSNFSLKRNAEICSFAKQYVQSAFALPDGAKKEQEQRSLLMTQDAFKKIIITTDSLAPLYNEEGVLIMSIFDFLLDENSLEL